MPNKNYNSGRQFEYRVKKFLEQKGYYVMRSAGSKSPFDLIAIPRNHIISDVLLVQCKHGVKVNKKEKDKINHLRYFFHDVICMVAWSKIGGQIEFYWWQYHGAAWRWTKIGWL